MKNNPIKTEGKIVRWPDFLVIGAGKSGTTSLNYYLRQHPDIFMSPYKEPNFYGFEVFSEADFQDDLNELQYFRKSITNEKDYLGLFDGAEKHQIIGEVSNTYMYHEHAPDQIKKRIPDTKIIAILRQPAERLFSRYLHLARDHQLPNGQFSDCLKKEGIWWERNDLVREGFYFNHLSRYYERFPSDNIKVLLFEDFKRDPLHVMNELFEFLKVDSEFTPDVSSIYNKSGYWNPYFDFIFGKKGLIKRTIPKPIYEPLKKNQWVKKNLNKLREKNIHRPEMDLDLKRKITALYEKDIESLSKLIKINLNHWLEFKEEAIDQSHG